MLQIAELCFNVDHGYLEGLVRGCKAGLLTQQDYINLVQCETLEGKLIFSQVRQEIMPLALGDLRERLFPGHESPEEVLNPRARNSGVHEFGSEKQLYLCV